MGSRTVQLAEEVPDFRLALVPAQVVVAVEWPEEAAVPELELVVELQVLVELAVVQVAVAEVPVVVVGTAVARQQVVVVRLV